MMKALNVSLAMMAISTASCASVAPKDSATVGRMIEFESGPEGFNTKTFFYEGAEDVVAFDAQFTPELAQKAIARLREVTQKPIAWLVVTHPNPDKFNGADVFKSAGARVVSSSATAKAIAGVQAYKEFYFTQVAHMFKPGTYPQPATIDQTFDESLSLVLRGGERIELKELAQAGVSSNQTVAFIPSVKALIVGDLVHHKAHAWLEGGIVDGKPTPTLQGWISDLRELAREYPANAIVYGGRGLPGAVAEVVPEQLRYLQAADAIVDRYISSLGAGRTELQGPHAQAHYREIQKLFERQFPDDGLGYMIGYGVYGLVNSKL